MKPGSHFTPEQRAKLVGRVRTPEHSAKLGAARRGHRHSAESRAKMRAAQLGRIHSSETRAKIAAANTGKVVSLESRAKMSAWQVGRQMSPEACAKMSAAHSTPEARARVSRQRAGQVASAESRARMSAASLGKPKSAETRARMVAAWKCGRSPETLLKMSENSRRAWADGRMHVPRSHRYTTLAKALHAHLERQGLLLEVEVRFGPYTVDLYDRTHHVAYEADCVYWHSKNEAKRPGYHGRRDNYLISNHGLKVVRYTDKEIKALTGWPKTKREAVA